MNVRTTPLEGVLLFRAQRFEDHRGTFQTTWDDAWAEALPPGTRFVRDGRTANPRRGTVRGLHAQRGLGKLVRCDHGRVLDVLVDGRDGSPTRERCWSVELSAASGEVLWVPPGVLHGYCTLVDHAVVAYRFTGGHVPGDESGLHWRSALVDVAWPVEPDQAVISERDRSLPTRLPGPR